MQFLSSLMTGGGNGPVTYVLALGFVLLLIILGLWLLKAMMNTTGAMVRPRSRRLQVVEQVPVDARRQLLLIRRDGVEHLVLIGGAQDLLVESGIPVEAQPVLPAPASVAAQARSDSGPTRSGATAAAAPSSRLDHLRELTRSAMARKPAPAPGTPPGRVSLRHTGLLRPVSVFEPAIIPLNPAPGSEAGDNSARSRSDSAMRPQRAESGRSESEPTTRTGDQRPDAS